MKKTVVLMAITLAIGISSCSSTHQTTYYGVAYQSIRPKVYRNGEEAETATIQVIYKFSPDGTISVGVLNNSDEIMIIDQTKSFLVNTDGLSQSYFDPTVRTETKTDYSGTSKNASVNLGAIGGALGLGGALGTLLNGVNVGGSNSNGTSTANTTYFADQPQISLAPHSSGFMSKDFVIKGIEGGEFASKLRDNGEQFLQYTSPEKSPVKFSVCISYSTNNGNNFNKLVTDFYVNAYMYAPVSMQEKVNDGLRSLLIKKSDAVTEPCGMFYFDSTATNTKKTYQTGIILVDFK